MVRPLYLLDTNIVSECIKPDASATVLEKLRNSTNLCAIPSPVWHELLYGMNRLAEGRKKNIIRDYLITCVQSSFPVFPYDEHASWIHADIRAELEKTGVLLPVIDSQIASIAIANNMILVTRNVKDFLPIKSACSFMMENWFE